MSSRSRASILNTVIALISEALLIVIGVFFPQAIIANYGSKANGLITSLQQFIQYFTILEAGLSGAALFSLYKPLADKDKTAVEHILYSAKLMYRRIGIVFVVCVVVASFIYPFCIADTGYSKLTVTALFCLTGLNGATQFLFIGKYKVLLTASQNNRYVALLNAISTCLYSVIIIVVAYCKLPLLLAVTLGASAYFVRSLAYYFVVRKLFSQYGYNVPSKMHRFKNQKEVFIQQILVLIILNSSIMILSFTKTDMAEISVYTIYNMILTSVFLVANTVNNGVSAGFGDLIAIGDTDRLKRIYREYEILFQIFWTVLFSCLSVLYAPFIALYTADFTDAAYMRPTLCVLFSILGAIWVIRNQQSIIMTAAGKFKEMQLGIIIETVLAVILSTIGLYWIGLEGILIGRIIASLYKVVDFIKDNGKIMKFGYAYTIKQILMSVVITIGVYFLGFPLQGLIPADNYISWGVLACVVAVISLGLSLLSNLIFNRNEFIQILKRFLKRI